MVQEYGRYFGMPTCCLRGGCLTGPNHSGVELHGFLSYLLKCNVEGREYKVFGYKGKQVRDNIHSEDVASFMYEFWKAPRVAEVYNLGGGKANSCSILEAFRMAEEVTGRKMKWRYLEENRVGDHKKKSWKLAIPSRYTGSTLTTTRVVWPEHENLALPPPVLCSDNLFRHPVAAGTERSDKRIEAFSLSVWHIRVMCSRSLPRPSLGGRAALNSVLASTPKRQRPGTREF